MPTMFIPKNLKSDFKSALTPIQVNSLISFIMTKKENYVKKDHGIHGVTKVSKHLN